MTVSGTLLRDWVVSGVRAPRALATEWVSGILPRDVVAAPRIHLLPCQCLSWPPGHHTSVNAGKPSAPENSCWFTKKNICGRIPTFWRGGWRWVGWQALQLNSNWASLLRQTWLAPEWSTDFSSISLWMDLCVFISVGVYPFLFYSFLPALIYHSWLAVITLARQNCVGTWGLFVIS